MLMGHFQFKNDVRQIIRNWLETQMHSREFESFTIDAMHFGDYRSKAALGFLHKILAELPEAKQGEDEQCYDI